MSRRSRPRRPADRPPPPSDDPSPGRPEGDRSARTPRGPRSDGLLEVGRVARPFGLRGEVIVDLLTDRTERLAAGSRLMLEGAGWVTVVAAHRHGRRWRVRFEGVGDRTAAEGIRGLVLSAEPIDDPDTDWVHELIGRQVREPDGTPRGTVVAVEANPAADLLVLESGAVVPMTFVVEVGAVITVEVPPGLWDL